MARPEFIEALKLSVGEVQDYGNGKVSFTYIPEIGRCAGQVFQVGYEVPVDFPLSSPSGPHVSPRILPNQSGGTHPTGGIHDSPLFGATWHYWSRPMHHWAQTSRSVNDVLAHLRKLFATL